MTSIQYGIIKKSTSWIHKIMASDLKTRTILSVGQGFLSHGRKPVNKLGIPANMAISLVPSSVDRIAWALKDAMNRKNKCEFQKF